MCPGVQAQGQAGVQRAVWFAEKGRSSQSQAAGMPTPIPASAATSWAHAPPLELPWLHAGLTWMVSVPFSLVSAVAPPPNRLEMVLPSSGRKKAPKLKEVTAAKPPPNPKARPACLPKTHTSTSPPPTHVRARLTGQGRFLFWAVLHQGLKHRLHLKTGIQAEETHRLTHLSPTNILSSWAATYAHPRDLPRCWPIPSPAIFYGPLS